MAQPLGDQAPPRVLIAVMALACGVGVSSLYFPQAITPLLASHFGVSPGAAAMVATLAQFGYATGIFFVLPLGDRIPRRPLITGLFLLVSVFLLVAGTSGSFALLLVMSAAAGIATVVPQVLMPMAAGLAAPGQAGRVMGSLAGGLVGGVLLARAFGGFLGELLGWRAPYLVTSAVTLVLAIVLARTLPATPASAGHRYPALLASSVKLFATLPELRRSALSQAMVFGGFTAAWTSVALYLTSPHFGYGTGVVGAVAVVGAGSMFAAPVAGRAIDRAGADAVSIACSAGMVVAALVMLTGLAPGLAGLAGLAAGLLLLDICVQCSQVANQARIFPLAPQARSRLNSVYMTSVFLGGSAGSWLGALLYTRSGWAPVCALAGGAALISLARHAFHRRQERLATAA